MSGLTIHGGAGGVQADVDDQRRWAQVLDRCGDAVRRAARHATDWQDQDLLLRTAIWSPVTAATSGLQLVDGVARVLALAVRTEAQAEVLRATASLTLLHDRLPGELVFQLQREFGGLATVAVLAGTIHEFLQPSSVLSIVWEAARDEEQCSSLVEVALRRLDEYGADLLDEAPWLVDMTINGLSELPNDLLGTDLTNEEAASLLVSALTGRGWLADDPVSLTPYDGPVPEPPRDPTDLVAQLALLRQGALEDGRGGADGIDDSLLGLTKVTTADGGIAWIVTVPGTQRTALEGDNPADFGTNLQLMAGDDAQLLEAARRMMEQAGVQPGEPILTAGHSQGGMAATRLAAQLDADGFSATHTLTLGSPVAGMPVPPSVQALSIEHRQDPVPRLDGRRNPDEVNRTTVTADAPPETMGTTIGPHGIDGYQRTLRAALDAGDPSVDAWADGLQDIYFTGTGETTWYDVSRS